MTFSQVFAASARARTPLLRRFEQLIAPENGTDTNLAALAAEAQRITRHHFGNAMRLFAPLYLSNECVNICKYCGFSRDNPIWRVTLTPDQVQTEADHLHAQGFRSILLVAGEHPKFVGKDYLAECVRRLRPRIPSVSIEVAPMEQEEYAPIVAAGADGVVVYQETYDREAYGALHTAGPKRDFDWRLDAPERGHAAGFRRLGIGALLGLAPWRAEALALAQHMAHLLRVCWKSQLTVSLPRLRPAAGGFEPTHPINDRDFTQLICALRVTFPTIGIVLSTRESAALRDGLAPLGITHMSAGSHTEPGGYTGAGAEQVHQTQRGKIVPATESGNNSAPATATEQFGIADHRSPKVVAVMLRARDLEPIWKDWDLELGGASDLPTELVPTPALVNQPVAVSTIK